MQTIKFLLVLLALILLSCASESTDFQNKAEAFYMEEEISAPGYSGIESDRNVQLLSETNPEEKFQSKIIKEANITIEVKEYSESIFKIKEIIKKWKGYISSENERNFDYSINNGMVIRVPAENFEKLIEEILEVAKKVDLKSIAARDVTEEFIDIEARLNTKKEFEKRYLELLKQAKNVDDILQVEQQLRIIREEIEAKEGRLKYLNNKVSFSTIYLEVYQKVEDRYKNGFFTKIREALKEGWNVLLNFTIGIFYVWPFIIILLVVVFIFIRKYRRKRKV